MKIILLMTFAITVMAQSLSTPEYVHAPLLMKIVQDDAALMKAQHPTYNIVVIYDSEDDDSSENKDKIIAFLNERRIALETAGIKLTIKPYQIKSKGQAFADLDNNTTHLMYVCSELDDDVIKNVKFLSQTLNIITFSGANDIYDDGGVSITTIIDDTETPQLLIKSNRLKKERAKMTKDYSKVANVTVEHP